MFFRGVTLNTMFPVIGLTRMWMLHRFPMLCEHEAFRDDGGATIVRMQQRTESNEGALSSNRGQLAPAKIFLWRCDN